MALRSERVVMRAWLVAASLVAVGGTAATVFVACDTSDACTFTAAGCDNIIGDAGSDSGITWPDGCEPDKDPLESTKCIDDSVAIFVSAHGSDGNEGTKDQPVQTLGEALVRQAAKGKPRIYICEGTYKETLAIVGGVGVYGGFTCTGWAKGGETQIAPDATADKAPLALTVTKVTAPVTLTDLSLVSPSAPTAVAGASSVAGFISDSAGVTFRRVSITAGDGRDGQNAPDPMPANLFPGDGTGNVGSGQTPAEPKTCKCPIYGASIGGGGGKGADPGAATNPAENGKNGSADPVATASAGKDSVGGAGFSSTNSACSPGHDGPDGQVRQGGAAATVYGTPGDDTPWIPAKGADGEAGNPGGGAGGGGGNKASGAGSSIPGGGGGGGGCGGCGGNGGGGGKGGGGSIALLVVNTPVTLVGGKLTTGKPGNGGHGSSGGGGGGGAGNGAGNGCAGGTGGSGAGGGGGAGGTGGVSLGIGYIGQAPVITDATIATGPAGLEGDGKDGGAPGDPSNPGAHGKAGAKGKPGLAKDMWDVTQP